MPALVPEPLLTASDNTIANSKQCQHTQGTVPAPVLMKTSSGAWSNSSQKLGIDNAVDEFTFYIARL